MDMEFHDVCGSGSYDRICTAKSFYYEKGMTLMIVKTYGKNTFDEQIEKENSLLNSDSPW